MLLAVGGCRSRLGIIFVVSVVTALLSACASPQPKSMVAKKPRSKEYFAESVYGVKASPRVSYLGRDLPRGGGRDQLGKPYQVRGVWYYPKEEKNYKKTGLASWYGDAFHGRLTANGEIYDKTNLTGAHPTMPLPSYARVTNTANGSSVIVRVNDRGPYHEGRVIDLSQRAAELLDYAQTGTAKVKVEYVGRAPLNGNDDRYLMASYRPGNKAPDPSDGLPTGVMIAMDGPTPSALPDRVPTPFPVQTLDRQTVGATAMALDQGSFDVVLPEFGPIAPAKPQGGFLVASAEMSYAPEKLNKPLAAFDVFDSAQYIAVGTFRSADGARVVTLALSGYGSAEVEESVRRGKIEYAVTLNVTGERADDALKAAWAAGAGDAFIVRD